MKPIDIIFPHHIKDIKALLCNRFSGCGKEIDLQNEFNDELSLREFYISGLCQSCQDEVFNEC